MDTLVIGVAIILLAFAAWTYIKANAARVEAKELRHNTERQYGYLYDLEQSYSTLSEKAAETELTLNQNREKLSVVNHDLEVGELKLAQAAELVEKEMALEGEKRRAEFEHNLAKQFEEMQKNSPMTEYQDRLKALNQEIEDARNTIRVQQQQALQAAQKEDFVETHSIPMTESEQGDIIKIKGFAPQLARVDAFFKLIWTEYYQKPLQKLCKDLGAEKVCGIYKVTHAGSERCYIGQATDIAARWKEHVKCGLGIGATSYQSNKFYKAMHTYGPEMFTFEILEIVPRERLDERERYWIDFYDAVAFGFNTKIGG